MGALERVALPRRVDGHGRLRRDGEQHLDVGLGEGALVRVQRLEHADGLPVDAHRDAGDGARPVAGLLGGLGKVPRVLLDVARDERAVLAEDGPGEAAVQRDRDLGERLGLLARRGDEAELPRGRVVEQHRRAAAVEQVARGVEDHREHVGDVARRAELDAQLKQALCDGGRDGRRGVVGHVGGHRVGQGVGAGGVAQYAVIRQRAVPRAASSFIRRLNGTAAAV